MTYSSGTITISGTFSNIPSVVFFFPANNNMFSIWIYNNGAPISCNVATTMRVSNNYKTFTFSASSAKSNVMYMGGVL